MADQPRRPFNLAAVLKIAAIPLVVLLVAAVIVGGLMDSPRDDCIPLEVNSGTEKGDLLAAIAEDYNAAGRTFGDDRCAAVSVHEVTSGAAMEALAAGWDPDREGAPEPQVWTPTSSLWLDVLAQRGDSADRTLAPEDDVDSITKSPLVIAMPRPMAKALGWPDTQVGWADILRLSSDPDGWGSHDHREWGRFSLGKDNPHLSTSGMAATIATFYAASGLSHDLTEADVADPDVRAFVEGVEAGVLHYADDAMNYLVNLYEADRDRQALSYVSAVVLQEQLLYLYNRGSPTGDPDLIGEAPEPRVPLVALYPEDGTLMMDHPYVVLPSASPAQRQAAADFLAYLKEPAQQERFAALGFRDLDESAGADLAETVGTPAGQELSLVSPPTPAVLNQILESWDDLRKNAKVLLVVDVSGSMQESTGSGETKLEAAKHAAIQALDLLHEDDEVGVWTFSDEGHPEHGDQPYAERIPLTRIGDAKEQIATAIDGMHAEGGTALYYTVREAERHMLAQADPSKINAVVVLSDGENHYGHDDDFDALLRDLEAPSLERSVRVFPIAFGEEAVLDVLTEIARVTRASAYDARDPAAIDKAFVSVLSNF